jgi:hypothetical protein
MTNLAGIFHFSFTSKYLLQDKKVLREFRGFYAKHSRFGNGHNWYYTSASGRSPKSFEALIFLYLNHLQADWSRIIASRTAKGPHHKFRYCFYLEPYNYFCTKIKNQMSVDLFYGIQHKFDCTSIIHWKYCRRFYFFSLFIRVILVQYIIMSFYILP